MKKVWLLGIYLVLCIGLYAQSDTTGLDPLLLKEIVITDFPGKKKLNSSISLTSIEGPSSLHLGGAADVLSNVPGMFVDASAGEVFSRIHTRGISLSAEEDIGWYYTSLQEDGLPVVAVQFGQFSSDFFLRPDISYDRTEVIKGGKASILAPNGPGGIVNFISKKISGSYQSSDRITLGFHNGGRPYARVEGIFGGSIGESSWAYDFSYLYRYDRGPRKVDFSWNNGGQFKIGLNKVFSKGVFRLKFKRLSDKVNRYIGVAATNWENPEPAFGQSFRSTSLLPPDLDIVGSNGEKTESPFNPADGIQTDETAVQMNLDMKLGQWRISNSTKYSDKDARWRTAIGGQPLGLENFLTYFISGDPFPAGLVEFRTSGSSSPLATVNNIESFNVFQGGAPGFEYIQGSLPNNAIMGSGSWDKDDSIDEFMTQLLFQREFSDFNFSGGMFYARSMVDVSANASFIYTTYEPEPRALQVILANPGEDSRMLSDPFGISNYDALFYEGAKIDVNQYSFFADGLIDLTENIDLNVGLRYENIKHGGTKDRFAPDSRDGGLDGNPLTSYDNGPLRKSGEDPIDFSYDYLSYSIGGSYELSSSTSLFARYSLGHKAPELNYYINNFSNQPVNAAGEVQKIRQLEMGFKLYKPFTSLTFTGFLSKLVDVPFSEFVFDDQSNEIFYTPTQLNNTQTSGIEIEVVQGITETLFLDFNGTLQQSELNQFTLYDANETVQADDDITINFSGNEIPHAPKLMFLTRLRYDPADWHASLSWQYMGKRYANISNAFALPAYGLIGAAVSYALNDKMSVGLRIRNVFNSAGLNYFFGPNEFGGNSNQGTPEYIAANPNGTFVVSPIMPRAIFFTFDYHFK